jgi:hypothetical protein
MKVKLRPDVYESIQFDPSPDGLRAMQKFLRGRVQVTYQGESADPLLMVNDGETATPGDWVVRGPRLDLRVYSPTRFEAVFEPA